MRLGIIGAMVEEITPLLEKFGEHKKIQVGGNTYYEITKGVHRV